MAKHGKSTKTNYSRAAALVGGAAVISAALSIGSVGAAATASAKPSTNPVSHLGHVVFHAEKRLGRVGNHVEKQVGRAGTNAITQTGTAGTNAITQTGTAGSNAETQLGTAGYGLLNGVGTLLGGL
jgi:hypothetical protein